MQDRLATPWHRRQPQSSDIGEMKKQVDIAITGGGLAGLLAACRLARTGRSICLIAPPRHVDRRTTALLGGSVDTLKSMDVWTELAPISQALRSIRILDGSRRLIRAPEVQFNASDIGLAALGYNVPNDPLLTALESVVDATGVARIGARANGIEVTSDAVSIACDNGISISAKLLVAADGQKSPSREFAGIAIDRSETGQSAIVCNFTHTAPHDDVSTEFHTESGPFTMVPLSPGRSALVWVVANTDTAGLLEKSPEQLSDAIYEQSHALLGTVHVEGQAQAFRLASGSAERLSSDRLILIGEAAHVLPPIAAQGFNLTIRDIEAAAGLVETAGVDCGIAKVTTGYDRARRADIELRVRLVSMLNRSLLTNFVPAQLARGVGLFALARIKPLRQLIMREGLNALPI